MSKEPTPETRTFPVDPYDTTEGLFKHPTHGPETPEQAAERLNAAARLGLGSELPHKEKPAAPADEGFLAALDRGDITFEEAADIVRSDQPEPEPEPEPADDPAAEPEPEPQPTVQIDPAHHYIDTATGEIIAPPELGAALLDHLADTINTPGELPGMPPRPSYNGDPITSLSLKLKTAAFAAPMTQLDAYNIGSELSATVTLIVTGHGHDTKKDSGELHRTIILEVRDLDT